MISKTAHLFAYTFVALCCFTAGYVIDKSHADDDMVTEAYALGRQTGYAEAQKNGACIRWWTGTSADDMRAAKRLFCRGR
jgi:hypothetical protein